MLDLLDGVVKRLAWVYIALFVLCAIFWIAVGYVVVHFVMKWW